MLFCELYDTGTAYIAVENQTFYGFSIPKGVSIQCIDHFKGILFMYSAVLFQQAFIILYGIGFAYRYP